MKRLRPILLLVVVFTCLLAIAPSASAQQANYGPWFPAPGSSGAQDLYRLDIAPFNNDTAAPEMLSFGCFYTQDTLGSFGQGTLNAFIAGQPIDDETLKLLGEVIKDARTIYADKENDVWAWADRDDVHGPGQAVRIWLREVKIPDLREKAGDQAIGGANAAMRVIQLIAAGQSFVGTIRTPFDLAAAVPAGCQVPGLSDFEELPSWDKIEFKHVFTDTGKFFRNLVFGVPADATRSWYELVEPIAISWSFWTPHSERGDLVWNIDTGCSETTDSCVRGQPLGFSQKNLEATAQNEPSYLRFAVFLQWLVSGTYFIILFASAIIYMTRGHRPTTMSVLELIPRLVLSVFLTIGAVFLIGALISFSNMLVTSIIGRSSAPELRATREVVGNFMSLFFSDEIPSMTGTLVPGASFGDSMFEGGKAIFATLLQIGTLAITAFYMSYFILVALARQVILIALIVLAPLACFCILMPRWQHRFGAYLRWLLVVALLPCAMAFALKIGIFANPLVSAVAKNATPSKAMLFFGLVMLLLTYWLMKRTVKLAVAYAKGQPPGAGPLNRLGGYTKRLGGAVMPANPALGLALGAAGGAAGGAGRISDSATQRMASLLPSGKQSVMPASPGGVRRGAQLYQAPRSSRETLVLEPGDTTLPALGTGGTSAPEDAGDGARVADSGKQERGVLQRATQAARSSGQRAASTGASAARLGAGAVKTGSASGAGAHMGAAFAGAFASWAAKRRNLQPVTREYASAYTNAWQEHLRARRQAASLRGEPLNEQAEREAFTAANGTLVRAEQSGRTVYLYRPPATRAGTGRAPSAATPGHERDAGVGERLDRHHAGQKEAASPLAPTPPTGTSRSTVFSAQAGAHRVRAQSQRHRPSDPEEPRARGGDGASRRGQGSGR